MIESRIKAEIEGNGVDGSGRSAPSSPQKQAGLGGRVAGDGEKNRNGGGGVGGTSYEEGEGGAGGGTDSSVLKDRDKRLQGEIRQLQLETVSHAYSFLSSFSQ